MRLEFESKLVPKSNQALPEIAQLQSAELISATPIATATLLSLSLFLCLNLQNVNLILVDGFFFSCISPSHLLHKLSIVGENEKELEKL